MSVRARKPEGGFDFILFHVPISRLVSSQTLPPPCLSSPPRSLLLAPPTLPFYLGCFLQRRVGGVGAQSQRICQDQRSADSNLSGIRGGDTWHLSLPSQTSFALPAPAWEKSLD